MLDRAIDDTMPGRPYAGGTGCRAVMSEAQAKVRPGDLADPLLFDFANLVIGAASPYTGPENP